MKPRKIVKNERGSQLIEFIAVFPMVILAMLFIWQMALVAYTVVITESAARDGARAAAVEGNAKEVAERSAGGLKLQSVTTNESAEEVTVIVVAKVPTVSIPFIGKINYTLDADATIPIEKEFES
ncbi:TadE/TadG family type IV pilus assembly protein [Pseudalkalibacillus berkeleyi]|uniref:Pilus assembly protein n=1 Tax=Pseudalkalibacillus berkeleyi TaxID=1069813 RepID=A0ABS9H3N1_9BACL|nr:TadE/TadG family type IV pilus assembly protein [Pseudalkalibacillus berkeleyi]MCF6139558.1 pilus assembly protein [Pseudalkalibacillus berkeleyi]